MTKGYFERCKRNTISNYNGCKEFIREKEEKGMLNTIKKAKKHIDSMIFYNHSVNDVVGYIKGLDASGLIDTEGFHKLMDYHYSKTKEE